MHASGEQLAARFGKRLRRWRRAQGLPQKAVARDIEVSGEVVSDWERGVRFPCERHLQMIEKHCRIPLCAFFRPDGLPCKHAVELD